MDTLSAGLYVQHVHVGPSEAEQSTGSPGTGVTVGCEPSRVCWESNLGSPEEQLPILVFSERFAMYPGWP